MGQFSVCSTATYSLPLSCSSNSHSYIIWSIDCSPFLHEHVGLSIILYLYKYDLILPWTDTIVVKFGVTLIFRFNLSAILGKYSFVIAPFVVLSHSVCHFFTLLSFNSLFTAYRLYNVFYFRKKFLFKIFFAHVSIQRFMLEKSGERRWNLHTNCLLLPYDFNKTRVRG